MHFISFTTRSGIKVVGQIIADDEHSITIRVTKARKPLTGKIMAFPKNDMANVFRFNLTTTVMA